LEREQYDAVYVVRKGGIFSSRGTARWSERRRWARKTKGRRWSGGCSIAGKDTVAMKRLSKKEEGPRI